MEIHNFLIEKETGKAILIKALIPETGKAEMFWLPKSKTLIEKNIIIIADEDFWKEKLVELILPTESPSVIIVSKEYNKGEKATKLIVQLEFNKNIINMFIWLPNSKIEDMNIQNINNEKKYFVTVKKWVWENSYVSAIKNQLEFYNKDEIKFIEEDFKLLSQIKHIL